MTNHVVLDNISHKDLKVITTRSEAYGDGVNFTTVMPSELRQLQSDFPLFLRKTPDSQSWEIIALLGLEQNENLFLGESGWQAGYLPLTLERQPFLIGLDNDDNPMVHIDMDSPRISEGDGELIFLAQGGNSPYLQRISSVLKAIHEGHEHTGAFTKTLDNLGLIEPVALTVELNNGEKLTLEGLHTINEEKVAALQGTPLNDFHAQSYLQLTHMMMASINNMSTLIAKKNAKAS
ncbi:MAG: SapC family protein [Algicola sp.]|nr:SapC family protein [Algicola sp.]